MDHKLTFDEGKRTKLKALADAAPEGPFRDLADRLAAAPDQYGTKNAVLAEFRTTLRACRKFGQADREALADDLERILDVFGIESSDGLLNEWIHGILL